MAQTQILIVEDEPIIARDLAETLTSSGYKVTAIASSGEEAVKKVVEQQPELLALLRRWLFGKKKAVKR